MISKQLLLGGGLFLGGAVAMTAVLANKDTQPQTPPVKAITAKQEEVARPTVKPMTADLETERRLLEQKRKEREARTLDQEKQAQALLAEQENAKNSALKKAQAEFDAKKAKETPTELDSTPATPSVKVRPEVLAAEAEAKKKEAELNAQVAQSKKQEDEQKAKQKPAEPQKVSASTKTESDTKKPTPKKGQHIVAQGDNLLKLSRQYGIPVSVLASANGMGRNDNLSVGKTIKIPSKAEADKIQKANEAKKATPQTDAKKTDKKTETDGKKSDGKAKSVPTHYSVQVGMINDPEKAAAVANQYRQAGYKVTTSRTSKGVRILVGNEKSADAAKALQGKITKDSRVKTDGAWVKKVDTLNP